MNADQELFALALAVSALLADEFDLDGVDHAPELTYHCEIFEGLRREPPRRNGIRKWRKSAQSGIDAAVFQLMGEQSECQPSDLMAATVKRLAELDLAQLDEFGLLVAT